MYIRLWKLSYRLSPEYTEQWNSKFWPPNTFGCKPRGKSETSKNSLLHRHGLLNHTNFFSLYNAFFFCEDQKLLYMSENFMWKKKRNLLGTRTAVVSLKCQLIYGQPQNKRLACCTAVQMGVLCKALKGPWTAFYFHSRVPFQPLNVRWNSHYCTRYKWRESGSVFWYKNEHLHPSECTKGAFILKGCNRTVNEGKRSFFPLWQVSEVIAATDNCAI